MDKNKCPKSLLQIKSWNFEKFASAYICRGAISTKLPNLPYIHVGDYFHIFFPYIHVGKKITGYFKKRVVYTFNARIK